MVYRFAAERLLAGLDLYSTGLTGKPGELLFIYPPFAAVCALPLALLDSSAVHLLWLLGVVATLTYAVVRMLKSTGMQVGEGLFSLVALLVGVIAWLEPIRLTAELGQINLVLLALVVADLSPYASRGWAPSLRGECPQGTKQGKWTGIGVGPGGGPQTDSRAVHRLPVGDPTDTCCLVGHGNVRRHGRYRICLCACVIRPRFGCTADSTTSTASRMIHSRTQVWAACCCGCTGSPTAAAIAAMAVAAVAVLVAAIAYRHGQGVLAVAVVGMASAAASPFSWSHHWVWFAPLVVHLGHRAYVLRGRVAATAMWLLCALVGGWFVSMAGDSPQGGILSLRPGGNGTKSCLALMFSSSLPYCCVRRCGSGACRTAVT